jgi:hypothetical protein
MGRGPPCLAEEEDCAGGSVKVKRLFSMPALLESMPGRACEEEDKDAEEEICGVVAGMAAILAWRMRVLVIERAANRPWGCWKTSDRSGAEPEQSEG